MNNYGHIDKINEAGHIDKANDAGHMASEKRKMNKRGIQLGTIKQKSS